MTVNLYSMFANSLSYSSMYMEMGLKRMNLYRPIISHLFGVFDQNVFGIIL